MAADALGDGRRRDDEGTNPAPGPGTARVAAAAQHRVPSTAVDEVHVTETAPGRFTVEVRGARTTTHEVRAPAGLADAIGRPQASDAELVRASFAFLLERESNTAILRSFSLEQIESYFSDWREDLARRLG